MRKYIISTLIIIILWILFWVGFSWSTLDMTNISFMVGLIGLTIYVVIRIIQSGFFDLFVKSMHQLKRSIFRKSNASIQIDKELNNNTTVQSFKSRVYQRSKFIILMISLSSIIMSFFGLIVFYIEM